MSKYITKKVKKIKTCKIGSWKPIGGKSIEATSKIARCYPHAFSPMIPFCMFSKTSIETNISMTVVTNHTAFKWIILFSNKK